MTNMYEKIIEIIVYVISELRQNKNISEINLNELQIRGYTNSEISTAFSWLVDRVEFSEHLFDSDTSTNKNSFRILHDAERDIFTTQGWGDLIQMNQLGIVTNEHLEMMVERAMMMGVKKIDSQQLKIYVANHVFNAEAHRLPGNRFMLNGNDTIN